MNFISHTAFIPVSSPVVTHQIANIPHNTLLSTRNPKIRTRPKSTRDHHLRLALKPKKASQIRLSKKRWRRLTLRDSSRGELVAEFQHHRVWFHDNQSQTRCWHLLIRRTPKARGKGWDYKYSLSNAPLDTPIKILAYRQVQRYWVERALQDVKDGLGMDEYQFRKWRAWHHHVALTMLAALYVLETRVANRDTLPLLSITDVREILE